MRHRRFRFPASLAAGCAFLLACWASLTAGQSTSSNRPGAAPSVKPALVKPAPTKPAPAKPPPAKPAKPSTRDELGSVEGIAITQADWDRLAKPYFEEVEAKAGRKLNDEERKLLRRNVLDELIRERLWLSDARRRGLVVTESAIDSRMMQSKFFQTGERPDEAKFRAFKRSPTSNYRVLRAQVGRALLLEEYVRWMERRFGPREAELKRAFDERTSLATIRYFLLGPDAISLEPEASAAQVRAYYEAHPDEFESADEARVQYIRVQGAAEGAAGDSARQVSRAVQKSAEDLITALLAGAPPETAAQPHGGLHDPGWFRLGEPIRGLGRSDELVAAIRKSEAGRWSREPVRVGPHWIVFRVVERKAVRRLPLVEVAATAKRKADTIVRDEALDSLAQLEVKRNPESYYAPRIVASLVARGLDTFEGGAPPRPRDIDRRLERLRREGALSDSSAAALDSARRAIPELLVRERREAAGFRTMREAASRLAKRESAARVATRHLGVLSSFQLYRGRPPRRPLLVEGAVLDSLYLLSPGAVLGPRVKGDSVFVVRVDSLRPDFLPPFEAVRSAARTAVLERRRAELAREAEEWFRQNRGSYHTPRRWILDAVVFRKPKPDSISIPEDSVASYWKAHPLEFTEPGRVRARHILARTAGPSSRAAARAKAAEARKRITEGEDFATVARAMSEDPSSAARGGELGELSRGSLAKEFADIAFTLPIGEVSKPVETRFGYHVIQVEERTPERLRPLEECREEILGVLRGQAADSLARAAATAFAAAATQPGASFDSLARAHGGAVRTGPIAPGGEILGAGSATWLEPALGPLADGGVTPEPIELPDGYVVARRVQDLAPEEAPYADVRERVLADYQMQRRRAAADSLHARFRAALQAGADPDTLFIAFGGLRLSRPFGRQGPIPDLTRDPALARDSTFLSRVFSSKPGTTLPVIQGSTGALYSVVDKVTQAPSSDFAKQRDALHRELIEQRIEAWTARLRSKASIRLHRRDLIALLD